MTTLASASTRVRGGVPTGRVRVPWGTVLPVAVVTAYTGGFWSVALRGAVGSIERAQAPFTAWLQESTLLLPVYVFSVLAALTLALRMFGPHPQRARAAATTLPLIVVAATLTGIAVLIANSAYDYQLQIAHLETINTLHGTCGPGCLADQQQATLDLQVRAVGLGSLLLLVSNLALVGLVVAFRGGRLDLASPRRHAVRLLPLRFRSHPGATSSVAHAVEAGQPRTHGYDLRPFLVAALLTAGLAMFDGSGHISELTHLSPSDHGHQDAASSRP